jgi:hypothetical protein
MLKKEMELEFINSFGLEDYLWKILKDEEIEENYKTKIVDFLKEFIGQDLYAAEYIGQDRVLRLNVETGNEFVLDSIDLCEIKFAPTTTKQKIQKALDGEISEKELMSHLHGRADEQIVSDLKNNIDFEGLIQVQEALENYLDVTEATEENKSSIEQTEKALENVQKAIRTRCSELISSEKKLKELLCN